VRATVVAEACRPPADVGLPVTQWSHVLLAGHMADVGVRVSARSVGRILATSRLQPHRQRMWMTSQDDDFRAKRDDVLHVYYDTPTDEHLVCVDEKTGIQARERRYADLPMTPGQPVRREFEYVRHGTQVLMGALDVRTGRAFGFVEDTRGTAKFLALLDMIDTLYPTGRGHIICDNLVDHDNDEVREWFDEHPRWTQHFTPKHASWLNQIECWFAILQRRVIARGSFTSQKALRDAIYAYMMWHDESAQPFHWTYRPKSWDLNPGGTSAALN
jgi:hypothetical protein